jgi:pilus assembly protein CpaE
VRLPIPLKVLVSSTSAEVIEPLLAMVKNVAGVSAEVVVGEAGQIDDSLMEHQRPDVFIADIRLDNPSDLERLQHFAHGFSVPMCIIATSRNSTVEGVRRLMRLGISDFLPQPINREELMSALQHAARRVRQSKPSAESQVITFLHAGGGAGATTIAINVACAIRMLNKNTKVCILDFDLQFGQVAVNLDLSAAHGILDVLESSDRLDPSYLEGVMGHHKSGVDILAAPEMLVALDSFPSEVAVRLINVAAELYDYVIVDMPLALTNWTQAVLGRSNLAVLVGQLTVPGIRQLRRLAGILASDGLGDMSTVVVLNRYLGGWKTAIRPKEAEKVLGRPINFLISNDFKTASVALDQGVPLVEVGRRSAIARNILSMTKDLVKQLKESNLSLLAAE